MSRHPRSRTALPTAATPVGSRSLNARVLLSTLVVGSLGLLGACGGEDGDTDSGSSQEASGTELADDQDAPDSGGSGDQTLDPSAVAACLDDAGFATVASSELLSEQQVEDQLTAFGQTESLTFDAEANAFAGGVSFYESPERAAERAETLADVAKAQSVVGNVLISIEAGTGFDDAVAAAESCLEE